MKVVYVLNGAALYGGVKVVYQSARALLRLGVEVEVVSPDPPSSWFPGVEQFYRQVPELTSEEIGPADIAVGTIWFTVTVAQQVVGAVPFHLCQCYEGLYDGVRDQWPEIDAVYRQPTRKLAVSPHLVTLLEERFSQTATWIPQPFEPDLFAPPAVEPAGKRRRILLSGRFDLGIKGIAWGMRALRPLYEREGTFELVRIMQEESEEEVELWPEAERHVAIPPLAVPEVMRSVDLYLGLSDEVEGFGLPALEAMGCGRACVLTDIGATRALDPRSEGSVKVPLRDADALVQTVSGLLSDSGRRAELGRAGRRIAEQFTEERTAKTLVASFEEALAHV